MGRDNRANGLGVNTSQDAEQNKPLVDHHETASTIGSITQKDVFNCVRFLVTGGGFMVDQYNLFILGTVMTCMKQIDNIGKYSHTQEKIVKMLILVGAVFGQLAFGTIGDVVGRRPAFLITLSFVISGAVLSAGVPGIEGKTDHKYSDGHGNEAYWWLGAFQFLLGFGVGGEYPLSASVSRESSPDFRKIGYTFCMQGAGFVLGPIIFLILLAACDGDTTEDLGFVWRGALAFSAIPGIMLIYPRWQLQGLHSRAAAEDGEEKPKVESFCEVICRVDENGERTNLRRFLGTTLSWFLFDISFYGNSIMATTVFDNIGISDKAHEHYNGTHQFFPNHTALSPMQKDDFLSPWDPYSGWSKVHTATIHMLIVACLGLPGYFMSVLTVSRLGLFRIQLLGFTMMMILFAIIAISYHEIKDSKAGFFILYGLTFFFTNWGPNYTTFINPTLLFETNIRARAHGMSAAAGKVGGALGVFVLAQVLDSSNFQTVCWICTGVAAFGVAVTLICFPRDIEAVGARIYKKPINYKGRGDEESDRPISPASTMH